jgi:hypothetical protein
VLDLADGGGDFGVAGLPDEADGEVTEGGHYAGAGPGPDPRGIFTVSNVPHVVDWASHCSLTVGVWLEQAFLGGG